MHHKTRFRFGSAILLLALALVSACAKDDNSQVTEGADDPRTSETSAPTTTTTPSAPDYGDYQDELAALSTEFCDSLDIEAVLAVFPNSADLDRPEWLPYTLRRDDSGAKVGALGPLDRGSVMCQTYHPSVDTATMPQVAPCISPGGLRFEMWDAAAKKDPDSDFLQASTSDGVLATLPAIASDPNGLLANPSTYYRKISDTRILKVSSYGTYDSDPPCLDGLTNLSRLADVVAPVALSIPTITM